MADEYDTHIVRITLPTHMQQRRGEIAVRHLHPIIQSPQRRAKRVRQSREPSTRRGIRLHHKERLAILLREVRGVQVYGDDADAGRVVEVVGELGLWVPGLEALSWEGGSAVVVWVAGCVEYRSVHSLMQLMLV